MAKTTPVRWWRDDETRYEPRRARAPHDRKPDPQWMVDLLAQHDPVMAAAIAAFPPVSTITPIEFERLEPNYPRMAATARPGWGPSPLLSIVNDLRVMQRSLAGT